MPVSRRRNPRRRPIAQLPRESAPDRLASRGRRIFAAVLDRVVLATVLFNVALAFASPDNLGEVFGWHFAPAVTILGVNEVVGTALWGQTIGKHLLGIRVVRTDNFDVPGWRRAMVRTFGLLPFGWMPYGGLAAETADEATFFFSRRRQALHDMMSGTLVVDDAPWRKWVASSTRKARQQVS